MDLSLQLNVAAALGSLGLGLAALARNPRRRRSQLFTLLCASMALWNLGLVGEARMFGVLTEPPMSHRFHGKAFHAENLK